MLTTYARIISFQYMVLKGAIAQLRNDEEGMTTLEVLVIAAGLVALAGGVVAVLAGVAGKKGNAINNATPIIIATT